MKKFMFAAALAAAGFLTAFADTPGVTRTKILGHGWDILATGPAEILENADRFAAVGYDGVFIPVRVRMPDGTRKRIDVSPSSGALTKEMLEESFEPIKRFATTPGLKESLIQCWWAPKKRVSWADDETWARFAANMKIVTKLSKTVGLKGVVIDNEDYPKSKQFKWKKDVDGEDYEAVRALVRRRGVEVGQAMFEAYPDMVFLSFWFLSEEGSYFTCDDPRARMTELGDLWPAFVDGLLDVMPWTVKMVDGNEHCYHSDAARFDFYKNAWNVRQVAPQLISPENRAKYLSCLSVSAGIYLDMYVNKDKAGCYYFGPGQDGRRVTKFAENLAQACRVAHEYVWVYGEKAGLIEWKKDTPNSHIPKNRRFRAAYEAGAFNWEAMIPGYSDTLRALTDPEGLAREVLARADGNLVDMAHPGFWQAGGAKAKGKRGRDGAAHVLTGVKSGCLSYELPVKPGELYAVAGAVNGRGSIVVTWRSQGALTTVDQRFTVPKGAADAQGWQTGATTVCVPAFMDKLVVHCSVSRLEEDESTKFRDVRVVNVRPQTVRLVSYNIRHGEGADGKVDLGRTAAVLNAAKPDFVALQELDNGRKRSGGVDQMKELGRLTGMWPAFGKALEKEGDGSYGVGLLARREPKSVRTVTLPGAPDMEPRALLIAEFDDVCFASTHLANGKENAEWRVKSAEVIAAEAAKCGKPFIVCGDWNDEAESPALAKMREGFQLLSQTDAPTFFGYKPGTTARCIDYIAVDAAHAASVKIAAPSRVVRAEGVSDHALLEMDVVLKK